VVALFFVWVYDVGGVLVDDGFCEIGDDFFL